MKKTFLTGMYLLAVLICSAQQTTKYKPLDPGNPVVFNSDNVIYNGESIKPGPKTFFIDGQFSDEEASKYPYVFNSINEAAKHLTDGSSESPNVVLACSRGQTIGSHVNFTIIKELKVEWR